MSKSNALDMAATNARALHASKRARLLGATVAQVKECFNCGEALIQSCGDIWIEQPMTGHWLWEHEWETLAKFLEEKI